MTPDIAPYRSGQHQRSANVKPMTTMLVRPGSPRRERVATQCRHAAQACISQPWSRESDMLPAVLGHRKSLVAGAGWHPFFEVAGPLGGIVDLLWVRFSRAVLSSRTEAQTALDLTSIRALEALTAGVPGDSLATYTGVSSGHLSQNVLPKLLEAGWVARDARSWVCLRPYRSPATAVVAVELKRDDWRTALKQAARHRAAADESWVVLDARRVNAAASAVQPFAHAGVGLAALSLCEAAAAERSSQLRIIHTPSGLGNSPNSAGRAFFGEQCLAMWQLGSRSGPERKVFGRSPVASV